MVFRYNEITEETLKGLQKEIIKTKIQPNEAEVNKINEFINSLSGGNDISWLNTIETTIVNNVEKKLEGINESVKVLIKTEGIGKAQAYERRMVELIRDLEDLLLQFQDKTGEKFDNAKHVISNLLNQIQGRAGELAKELDSTNGYATVQNLKGEKVNLFRSLSGLSSDIKGYMLEAKVTEYIQEKLKKLNSNLEVLNTGSFTIGGKDIKEDIGIGEDIEKTISEWVGNNSYSVLTDDQVEILRQKFQLAISVKAAKEKNNITLHKGLSLNKLKIWASEEKDSWVLNSESNIDNKTYHMYANYIISKHLNEIVGEKNNIFIHRNQIKPTYEYLLALIDEQGRYAKSSVTKRIEKNTNVII